MLNSYFTKIVDIERRGRIWHGYVRDVAKIEVQLRQKMEK